MKTQEIKINKEKLKSRSFYRMYKILNRVSGRGTRLTASRKMTDMVLSHYLDAIKGKKPSILTAIWCPSEIIYSLGMVPICLETTAASLAAMGLSDEYLSIAEKEFHSRETCTFLRCSAGTIIDKLYPQPAAVVATSHLCDAGAKSISMAANMYGCKYFLIDIPQEAGNEAEDYVAAQLEKMAFGLADITGKKFNRANLEKTIKLSNKARLHALQVNEYRRAIPAPMLGSEALNYLLLTGLVFGSREGVNIYKSMAHELGKRTREKYTPLGKENHRLLWLHLKPFFPNKIFHYLEKEKKVAVAFEEINHVFWDELDPSKPFKSVARRLISNTHNQPIESWLDTYMELIKKYSINGVVHYSHWGCRWNYGRTKIIKDAFQEQGVPFISIDCDSISPSNYNETQIINRLETFLDILS